MLWLRQSTGTSIVVGPILSLGGTTPHTSVTEEMVGGSGSAGGSCKLQQNGTSTAVHLSDWTHAGDGWYQATLSASTVGTYGWGKLTFTSTTPEFLPFWSDVMIQPTLPWDAFIADSDRWQVDLRETHAGVTLIDQTYTGVTIAGVTRVQSFTSNAKGELGGVTVAGVSCADKVNSGVTINDFSSQAKGTLGGVTMAGVSKTYLLIDFTSTAKGTLGGVTMAGVSNAYLLIDFSSTAKGTLGGVTVAGVSLADKVSSGVTINDFSSQAKGTLGGVTMAGVSKVYGITVSGVTDIYNGLIEASAVSSLTFQQSIKLQNAVLFGISTGGGGTTAAFQDLSGSTDRVRVDTDANGNRSNVTLDVAD